MGDDPKPRDEADRITAAEVARMNVAIDARIRQSKAEASRARGGFRPAPAEIMIQVHEGTAEEILALATSGPQRGRSRVVLPSYIRKRLADVGVLISAIPAGELSKVRARLGKAALEGSRLLDQHIKEEFDPFIKRMASSYKSSPQEIEGYVKDLLEKATFWKLEYYRMSDGMVNYVEERLRSKGIGDVDAINIAEKVIAYFQNPNRYPNLPADRGQVDLVVDLVVSANVADFNRAAKLTLPPRAPAVWSKREDREEGENVVQFLDRVWGRYIAAGVLYQDDIKRLGDPKLVASVRTYCHQNGLDASSVLPPPKRVRLERALAQVEPGSPAAIVLQGRLKNREALARRRKEQRLTPA